MYRIAMVAACPFPANYGSAASIREMSAAVAARGHEVHVVTYHLGDPPGETPYRIHRIPNVPTYRKMDSGPAWQKPLLDFLLLQRLVQVARRERIQLFHAHNYEAAIAALCARRLTGIPVLYNAVTNMVDELPTYNFIKPRRLAVRLGEYLDRNVPRRADAVTAVSEDLEQFLAERGVERTRLRFLPAGVNPEDLDDADGAGVRKRHGFGDRPLVIYAGVLDPYQGMEHLLAAMLQVRERLPEVRLLVLASSDPEPYQREAERMGLGETAVFFDRLPFAQVRDYLAAANVGVVPRPICPGFPVKLLNYMSAQLAAVSFEGSARALTDGHDGRVIPNGDTDRLAAAISDLLERPAEAERLGRNARRTVEERFSWHSLAGQVESVYDSLLGARQGSLTTAPSGESRS